MDKEEDNKTTEPLYPTATRGPLSDTHTDYATEKKWAGKNPDKYMKLYFIMFLIVMGFLFIVAVKSLSSSKFVF